MIYCSNCGAEIADNDKFCKECGTKNILYSDMKKNTFGNDSIRKQVFDGEVRKCPNCGEILNAFQVKCSSCGMEIRDAKSTNAVQELSDEITRLEQKRQNNAKSRKNSASSLRDIFYGKVNETDESVANVIRSFPIPNTKEDLLEFFFMAASSIDTSVLDSDYDGRANVSQKVVSEAWIAKFEQAYQKSLMMLDDNDDDVIRIKKVYEKKTKEIKKGRNRTWRILGGFFLAIVGAWVLLIIFINFSEPTTDAEKIKKRESHLEYVVEQIEDDIADGKYTDAKNKAHTLTFDEDLSKEKSEYWKRKKKEILELIEEAGEGNEDMSRKYKNSFEQGFVEGGGEEALDEIKRILNDEVEN